MQDSDYHSTHNIPNINPHNANLINKWLDDSNDWEHLYVNILRGIGYD